jgi:methionine synthase II (cobalamin-independent)
MYNATELEDFAKAKILNAQISKPAIAKKLKQDAAELRAYAALIKIGWNEAKFQKRLAVCQMDINRRTETFNQLLEHDTVQAKQYYIESKLADFIDEAKMLRFLLEIEEVEVCK